MPRRKAFLLRMSPDLWKELETWAQQELRSVNGQIEFILREAVRRRKRLPPQTGAEEKSD
jgi:hypothetical protein